MSEPAVTRVEERTDATIIHVQVERLDEDQFWLMRTDVLRAGAQAPKLPVVLDLSRITFIPSLSLGGLIRLSQEFKARQQRILLACVQPKVRETMAITRVDTLFEMIEDLETIPAGQ